MKKKVALVLGGGSALGFAHIGVIKALEDNGINVDMIVGTSMGSLVGATYACGLTVDDMIEFAKKFRKIHFLDFNFNASGLFSGRGVMRKINKFLPDTNIEDLKIKFACVSCDLLSEKEVVFKNGNVRDAVRSSMSIPGFFVPFRKDDMFLIDGGIVNNLPVDVAKEMGADVIISVDVLSKCKLKNKPKTAIDTLLYGINISTKEIQKHRSCNADIMLVPDTSDLTQLSFGKKNVELAIEKGKKEVNSHLKEIFKLIK